MAMTSNYKPIGGVESVVLYPAEAVARALFSSEGCEVELLGSPIEVALLEYRSQYEESTHIEHGAVTVSHRLQIVADRSKASAWLDNDFVEQATFDGFVGVVSLCDGRRLLVGYSALLGNEQPLRLEALISSSGTTPHDTPTVTLQLISHDADFSATLLQPLI